MTVMTPQIHTLIPPPSAATFSFLAKLLDSHPYSSWALHLEGLLRHPTEKSRLVLAVSSLPDDPTSNIESFLTIDNLVNLAIIVLPSLPTTTQTKCTHPVSIYTLFPDVGIPALLLRLHSMLEIHFRTPEYHTYLAYFMFHAYHSESVPGLAHLSSDQYEMLVVKLDSVELGPGEWEVGSTVEVKNGIRGQIVTFPEDQLDVVKAHSSIPLPEGYLLSLLRQTRHNFGLLLPPTPTSPLTDPLTPATWALTHRDHSLGQIATLPAWKNHGLATLITKTAIASHKRAGERYCWVYVASYNVGSLALSRKCGMRPWEKVVRGGAPGQTVPTLFSWIRVAPGVFKDYVEAHTST
ncbi:hypothetical protein DFS34DRAFT_35501 [Phlyctochytrium arcticum]|nr:hypothetical protein DFS34DRAFT_35501 [Phlyctochytrium arcticum]